MDTINMDNMEEQGYAVADDCCCDEGPSQEGPVKMNSDTPVERLQRKLTTSLKGDKAMRMADTMNQFNIPRASLEQWIDISDEVERTYVFPNGSNVTIDEPMVIKITRKQNELTGDWVDSHRIVDQKNRAHYIPSGWIHLSWESWKENPFLF